MRAGGGGEAGVNTHIHTYIHTYRKTPPRPGDHGRATTAGKPRPRDHGQIGPPRPGDHGRASTAGPAEKYHISAKTSLPAPLPDNFI